MSQARLAVWRGRGVGALAGMLVLVGGAMAAAPEYVNEPERGLPVAAAGVLLGFVTGTAWDRRAARRQAEQDSRQRWESLFTDRPGRPSATSGAGSALELLAPESSPVEFERGHLKHVTPIRRWCTDREPGRVWKLAGGPGAGKTRVAMRVVENLRQREREPWDCGWLIPGGDRAAQAVALAADWPRPVLIVVDDAELRTDLSALLTAVHDPVVDPRRVRLVLIAREFGGWWTEAQQPLRTSVDTAAEHPAIGPVAADPPGQVAAARRAAAAYARELRITVAPERLALAGIGAGTPTALLHATALEAVLRTADGGTAPVEVGDAVAALLDRERERWRREAARQGLTGYPQVTEDTLRDALVVSMMVGAADAAAADRLLRRVPGLADASPELIKRVTNWLHLYGVVAGYHSRPHLPAIVGEHLIVDALAGNPELAGAVTAAAETPEQAGYALAVVARAARHVPGAQAAAEALLTADPTRLLGLAITHTQQGIGPLDHAIAAVVPHAGLEWDTANLLYRRIPNSTQALLHTAVALAHARIPLAPGEAEQAAARRHHAARLIDAGRLREAVTAAEKAVTIWESLAAADPDAHRPGLARALTTLSRALRLAGRNGAAVTRAAEAVTVQRALAAADPDAHQPALARALTALANALSVDGRYGEAATAAQEAVAVWRALVAAHPDVERPYLADALTSLADALRHAGRREEAVMAAREAVTVRRALAAINPDAQRDYFAYNLTVLANCLDDADRHDEAVTVAQEAVRVRRALATTDPDAHRYSLGDALTTLAHVLDHADRHGEATTSAEEAVMVLRALADSDAHRSSLAQALGILAVALRRTGRDDPAVTAAREAVSLYRSVPDGERLFAHNLAMLRAITGEPAPPPPQAEASGSSTPPTASSNGTS